MKILYAFLAAIAVYLLGAFYRLLCPVAFAGFDISLWSESCRGLVAIGMAGGAVMPFLWVD